MQNNRACGEDNIHVEHFKLPGILNILLPVLNKALLESEIPLELKTQLFIPIPKKEIYHFVTIIEVLFS